MRKQDNATGFAKRYAGLSSAISTVIAAENQLALHVAMRAIARGLDRAADIALQQGFHDQAEPLALRAAKMRGMVL